MANITAGKINGIDIELFFNFGFVTRQNGKIVTIRPLGSDILTNQNTDSPYKHLADILKDVTGFGGLNFPDINSPAPFGYKVAYFYDTQYNVTGWNWQLIGTTLPNQFETLEEANSKIKVSNTATIPTPEPAKPIQPAPTQQLGDFAVIGKEYTSNVKPKLILPSCNNDRDAQIFRVSKDGKLVYGYDRPQGWNPQSAYWGNHPKECQFAVVNGNYDFYFKNTGTKPIIAGCTSGDQYAFYGVEGYLYKTDIWKLLQPNEEWSFTLYIENKLSLNNYIGSWDKVKNNFFLVSPFYENGQVTTDKVEVEGRPYGLEVSPYNSESFKFYKASDSSKYIVIKLNSNHESENGKFTVIEKNGLDIKPDFIMFDSRNVTNWKVFCNNAEGYVDYKNLK